MSKPLEKIIKEYPVRGPLKQYRFEKTISFVCFRCNQTKTSKLIVVYGNDWAKRLCNGCYGALLSIYEIKNGTNGIAEKSEELAKVLLQLVSVNATRQQENLLLLKNSQAKLLAPLSLKFLATSELVAATFGMANKDTSLDWSPAVIGICKAFELELTELFINKLRSTCTGLLLTDTDTKDKDFGRIASYCVGKSTISPELGVVSHFLSTAINSRDRLETSAFLNGGLKPYLALRPKSNWLIDRGGLAASIVALTKNFRNKAAHTDELEAADYEECKELVFGDAGMMWKLLDSTRLGK